MDRKIKRFEEFKKIFSCSNSTDIMSEFFFLVSNLYSSEDMIMKNLIFI